MTDKHPKRPRDLKWRLRQPPRPRGLPPRPRRRLVSSAKKPSTALSQDAEVGVKWNVQRGCRTSHLRGITAQTPQGALKVPRAFGVLVGHLPSAILSLPAFVSRSPPDKFLYVRQLDQSVFVFDWDCPVHQTLSAVPQRDEFFVGQRRRQIGVHFSNVRLRRCRSSQSSCHNQTELPGFPSGRLTSSNAATWVLSNQDSSVAPQTSQDA